MRTFFHRKHIVYFDNVLCRLIFSRVDGLSLSLTLPLCVCSVLEMSTSMEENAVCLELSLSLHFIPVNLLHFLFWQSACLYKRFELTKSRVFVAATVSSIHCTKHKVLNVFLLEFMTLQFFFSLFLSKKAIFKQRKGFECRVKIHQYTLSWQKRAEKEREWRDLYVCILFFRFRFLLQSSFIVAFCIFGCIFVESQQALRLKNKVIKYSINFDTTRYGRLITIIMWLFHCVHRQVNQVGTFMRSHFGSFFCFVDVAIPLPVCAFFFSLASFALRLQSNLFDAMFWHPKNILRLYHSMD